MTGELFSQESKKCEPAWGKRKVTTQEADEKGIFAKAEEVTAPSLPQLPRQ